MKHLKNFLTFALIAAVMLGTVDASAKTKRTKNRTKKTTTKTTKKTTSDDLSSQDVIDLFTFSYNYLSTMCPYECVEGVILESVSFKNKRAEMTMALSEDFMNDFGEYVDLSDNSTVLDFAVKNMAVKFIDEMEIPITTFAKTGIYYDISLQDSDGEVIAHKKVTNSDIVSYYKEQKAKNRTPGDTYGLDFFRNMVEVANQNTPSDNGDGLIMTNISMKGTEICYDFEVYDEEVKNNINSMPTLVENFMRRYMAENLYNVYGSYGDGILLDRMIENEISMKFVFHEQGKSKPIMSFGFSAREMKEMGESAD